MTVTAEDMKGIRIAKSWMETQIRDAVILATAEFYQKTNLQVTNVDINIIDMRTNSDIGPRSAIGPVTARVDI
jgi:hypothetical protein